MMPPDGESPAATTTAAATNDEEAPPAPLATETVPADSVAAETAAAPVQPVTLPYHLLAIALALLGGLLGAGGAIFEELRAGIGALAAGPIEEALKPAGIYILLVRWPWVLSNRIYTASLTALSGLVFALLEACIYVFVYFPHAGHTFVVYRFTAPIVMHTANSFIVGLGLDHRLVDWANKGGRFPRRTRNFYGAAAIIHTAFNVTAVILTATGVVKLK